jgi:AmmeMemoRadiSam system protein A
LTAAEGVALLRLARAAIDERLCGGGALAQARREIAMTEGLLALRGCFVTLKTPDPAAGLQLRGCIGSVEPRVPLHDAVVDAALHAAFDDPRFRPLESTELAGVVLSVSAMGIPEPVESADAIVAGRHGVILELEGKAALFLPEVASERGWSTRELLENLADKAGLPTGSWRDAVLQVFTSEHFVEASPGAC